MAYFLTRKTFLLVFIFLLISKIGQSQNVAINSTGEAPKESAGLDIDYSNKGLLIPRVELTGTTDNTTIPSPEKSLLVFNKTATSDVVEGYYYWEGTHWVRLSTGTSAASSQWTTNGSNIHYPSGNVGIGVPSPSYKLQVASTSNPLFISGLQTGTNGDSILTINNGVVRKMVTAPISSSNSWLLAGNAGTTSSHFLGTTDGQPLRFRTGTSGGTQRMLIDANGNIGVGTSPTFTTATINGVVPTEKFLVDAGTTNSFNVISGKGSINNYLQLNIQNRLNGTASSSDIVASADNATEAANFVNLGINSSAYSAISPTTNPTTSGGITSGPNTAYVYSTGGDFVIGNAAPGKHLKFFTNGTSHDSEQMRISSTGQVGIGSSDLSAEEKVLIDASGYQTALNTVGDINSYLQVIVQNGNSGNNASSDFVVANNFTPTSDAPDGYYLDFGINSTGYSENKSNILNQKSTPYMYSSAPQWFYIGNGYPQKGLVFFTNNGSLNKTASADGTPAMVITATGNVGIGSTFATSGTEYAVPEKLTVDGNIVPKNDNDFNLGALSTSSTPNRRWKAVYATNGTIQTSDRRLKTNIKPLEYGLTQVMNMKPVSYHWTSEPTGESKVGLIAQDLKKVVPEVVSGSETAGTMGVNYAELIPVLVNAIKEQQKQIEELKSKVETLEKK